jgi:hypothetical protein
MESLQQAIDEVKIYTIADTWIKNKKDREEERDRSKKKIMGRLFIGFSSDFNYAHKQAAFEMPARDSGVFLRTLPSLSQVGMSYGCSVVKVKIVDDKSEEEWKKKTKIGLG